MMLKDAVKMIARGDMKGMVKSSEKNRFVNQLRRSTHESMKTISLTFFIIFIEIVLRLFFSEKYFFIENFEVPKNYFFSKLVIFLNILKYIIN